MEANPVNPKPQCRHLRPVLAHVRVFRTVWVANGKFWEITKSSTRWTETLLFPELAWTCCNRSFGATPGVRGL